MPKGHFQKLKGAICNIATDTSDITNNLLHGADSIGLIMVKLKHKLSFELTFVSALFHQIINVMSATNGSKHKTRKELIHEFHFSLKI